MEDKSNLEGLQYNEPKILDVLELHNKSDKDPRALILASGKNLNRNFKKIIKELNKKFNKLGCPR